MDTRWLEALQYACNTRVVKFVTFGKNAEYAAYEIPCKANFHVPRRNITSHFVAAWDRVAPLGYSAAELGVDDYWVARPLLDRIALPDFDTVVGDEPTDVYRYYNAAGQLLYVGVTNFFARRDQQHKTIKNWKHEIDHGRTTIESHRTRQEALAREAYLIRAENPRYNIQGAVR